MVDKFFIYALSLLFVSHISFAQKKFQADQYREVQLNTENTTTHFVVTMYKTNNMNNRTYFWYDNKSIHQTQGSYAGYLLHGEYKEMSYPGNDLIQAGKFKKGQKNGKWIEWDGKGKIRQTSTWKNGRLDGKKTYYDTRGAIVKIESYRAGKCIDCIPKQKRSISERLHNVLRSYNIAK